MTKYQVENIRGTYMLVLSGIAYPKKNMCDSKILAQRMRHQFSIFKGIFYTYNH